MSAPTISFDGAGKCFDDRWIVRDLDVEVHPGTILGVIGPSGCGKTTAVRLLNGVYRPDEGSVSVLGEAPADRPTKRRTVIGYLPQAPVLFDDLTVRGNLNFHASLNGVPWRRRRRLREVIELVALTGEERKLVRDCSGGMKRRVGLAATLVHDPRILVLDEPTAGIDPLLRKQIWEHFRTLRDLGRTVVVTTQHVNEATHCDTVVVLDEGHVLAVGTPDELRRRAYGGDIVAIGLATFADERTISALRDIDGVVDVRWVDERSLRLVVGDAGRGLAAVQARLEALDVQVDEAAEVPADWDDAFIELVRGGKASS